MTEKIYIQNPYLKNLQAKVVETEFKDDHYYLILDKTIFYPHLSGGQPRDRGSIDNVEIIDVFERKSQIVHVINEKLHNKNVRLSIEWDHRFDMMQQHTGQHILSLAIEKLFNGASTSLHIGESYSSIDVNLKDIDEKQIDQIEVLSNKIIQSNFPIKSYIKEDSEGLRIVEIENMDYNPCCGTHVYTTGEVGLIKIIKASNYKDGSRIEFLSGIRALEDYSMKHRSIKDISRLLSSRDEDAAMKVDQLFEKQGELEKENRDLRSSLYRLKAEAYLKDSKEIDGINYIVKDLQDMDMKELSLISSNLNKEERLIQIYTIKDKEICFFLVTRSHDLDIDLKEVLQEVSEKIILKGGGNPQTIQGKSSLQLIDKGIKLFYNTIRDKIGKKD